MDRTDEQEVVVQALVVVDVQNEFSREGKRPVPDHDAALAAILRRIDEARREGRPIAFVRHHNKPTEAPAFREGTWGAQYSPGVGPMAGRDLEAEFVKDVFGAFSGTDLASWLKRMGCEAVLLVGFFAHMCVSTTAREALMLGLAVEIDPLATGGHPLRHALLGTQSADEVVRAALLQLTDMGASIAVADREPSTA